MAAPCHSLDHECGATVVYLLPGVRQAEVFAGLTGGTIAGRTGRHVYTEWDPILKKKGAHHPALNPFRLKENRRCRQKYSKRMCAKSLAILGRAVMIRNHPDRTRAQVGALIAKIRSAAKQVQSGPKSARGGRSA